MKLFVVHSSEERFRCAFYTLVIRNKALEKHYKGGLHCFMNKYGARCNNHITVWCDMGSEINDVIDDLIAGGLKIDEDFAFLDVGAHALYQSMCNNNARQNYVDVGVNWLTARYVNGGIYVWYKKAEEGSIKLT